MGCELPQAVSFPHILTGVHQRFYLGGGIGSGKSAAAAWFRTLGAVVISGDDAGREVLASGTAETAAVLRRWPDAATPEGSLDRQALGRIVFRDAGELAALETITGPGIRSRLMAAAESHPDAVVMVEVPVLRDFAGAEWPWIVVDAPEGLRMARAIQRGSGMSDGDVQQVMARQPSRSEWLAAAAWVIDNSGDLGQLEAQCRRVWAAISRP